MKKIFIYLLLINTFVFYFYINLFSPRYEYKNILNNIIDINNTNVLINTYSNLIMEIVPANE